MSVLLGWVVSVSKGHSVFISDFAEAPYYAMVCTTTRTSALCNISQSGDALTFQADVIKQTV